MTKDEIVAEVLEAIAKELDQNEWPNAADVLRGEMRRELHAKVRAALAPLAERLAAELETERMRVVACGVIAMADTEESAAKARAMHADFNSAACQDVARRVDECIALRARLAASERERLLLREAMEQSQVCGRFPAWCRKRGMPDDELTAETWFLNTLPTLEPTTPATPAEPASEKERRVYYQNIVYFVCNVLDAMDNRKHREWIVCGTAEAPSTEVQDRMRQLLVEWHNRVTPAEPAKPSLEVALAVVQEWAMEAGTSIQVFTNGIDLDDMAGAYTIPEAVNELLKLINQRRHFDEIAAAQAAVDEIRKALAEAEAELALVKGGGA